MTSCNKNDHNFKCKDFNYDLIERNISKKKKKILREELKVSHVNNKCTCTNIHRMTLNNFDRPWKKVVRSSKHKSTNLPRIRFAISRIYFSYIFLLYIFLVYILKLKLNPSFTWMLDLTSFKFSLRSMCNFTINSHLILHYPTKRETNSFSVEVSYGIINKFIELWLIPSTRYIINNYCLVQWYNILNRKCSFDVHWPMNTWHELTTSLITCSICKNDKNGEFRWATNR